MLDNKTLFCYTCYMKHIPVVKESVNDRTTIYDFIYGNVLYSLERPMKYTSMSPQEFLAGYHFVTMFCDSCQYSFQDNGNPKECIRCGSSDIDVIDW